MSAAVAHALPASILALFAPRPPLEYMRPLEKRKMPPYTGMASYLEHFEDPSETPPAVPIESVEDRKARKRTEKEDSKKAELDDALQKYDPANDEKINSDQADAYKTLFVARLSFETTKETLVKNFEQFGPIKNCTLVQDPKTKQPRGYAFIEFEHERDMKTAYKQGDGRKIDNRRVLVDVERGRTVPNWRPRRLGGGLGSTRAVGAGPKKASAPGAAIRAFTSCPSMVGSAGLSQASSAGAGAPTFSWSTETRSSEDYHRRDPSRGAVGYGSRGYDDRGGGDRGYDRGNEDRRYGRRDDGYRDHDRRDDGYRSYDRRDDSSRERPRDDAYGGGDRGDRGRGDTYGGDRGDRPRDDHPRRDDRRDDRRDRPTHADRGDRDYDRRAREF